MLTLSNLLESAGITAKPSTLPSTALSAVISEEVATAKQITKRVRTLVNNARGRVNGVTTSGSTAEGLEFEIDIAWVMAQVISQGNKCAVTGVEFRWDDADPAHHKAGHPSTPSLDRIDIHKGYTKENTRIVSNFWNKASSLWTSEELAPHMEAIKEGRHG